VDVGNFSENHQSQIASGNAGWRSQFRFAVDVVNPRQPSYVGSFGFPIMNTSSTQESPISYYSNRQSAAVWGALVACVGVIGGGSSLAAHSFAVTSCFLLGTVTVGYLGYWALSKSCYFISASKAGFKDAFRAQEVQFDQILSAATNVGRNSRTLTFVCTTRTVTMPLDPIDEAWFSAMKAELLKRSIPVSSSVFCITVKGRELSHD
jgi:hypothetical protein